MRLVFLVPGHSLAGGNRVNHIYAASMAARGHEVTVIMPGPRVPTLRERFREFRRGTPRHKPGKLSSHFNDANYRLITLNEHRAIVASDLPPSDAVIATWYETAEWLIAMPPAVGAKIHFVQHYEAFTAELKPRVDRVLAAPTVKITIADWLEKLLREDFGNKVVSSVHNGVDPIQISCRPTLKTYWFASRTFVSWIQF